MEDPLTQLSHQSNDQSINQSNNQSVHQYELGPSPYDEYSHTLALRIETLIEQIASLEADKLAAQHELNTVNDNIETWRIAEIARLEAERIEREAEAERQRIEAERLAAEAAAEAERQRLEAERLEAERLEQERLEQERLEVERVEQERLQAERLEEERLQAERFEQERLKAERVEQARLEREIAAESERLERERQSAQVIAASPRSNNQSSTQSQLRVCNLICVANNRMSGDPELDEQSFEKGDLLAITHECGGWYQSINLSTKQSGLAPANYVNILIDVTDKLSNQSNNQSIESEPVSQSNNNSNVQIVRCLYDFEGQTAEELSLKEGDVCLASGELNGWLIGRLINQSKEGIFPKNYCEVVEDLSFLFASTRSNSPLSQSNNQSINQSHHLFDDAHQAKHVEMSPQSNNQPLLATSFSYNQPSVSANPPNVRRTPSTSFAASELASIHQTEYDQSNDQSINQPIKESHYMVQAIHPFVGQSEDEISINQLDQLIVTGEVGGWLIGRLVGQDQVGIFPANYCQRVDSPINQPINQSVGQSIKLPSNHSSNQPSLTAQIIPAPIHQAHNQSANQSGGHARSQSEFQAPISSNDHPDDNEPFNGNSVRDRIAALNQTNNHKRTQSLFVSNDQSPKVSQSVSQIGVPLFALSSQTTQSPIQETNIHSKDHLDSQSLNDHSVSDSDNANVNSSTSPSTHQSIDPIGFVTALYDFQSVNQEQLSFKKGTEIAVVKMIKGWYAGYLLNHSKDQTNNQSNHLGLIPSNYCTAFRPIDKHEGAPKVNQSVSQPTQSSGDLLIAQTNKQSNNQSISSTESPRTVSQPGTPISLSANDQSTSQAGNQHVTVSAYPSVTQANKQSNNLPPVIPPKSSSSYPVAHARSQAAAINQSNIQSAALPDGSSVATPSNSHRQSLPPPVSVKPSVLSNIARATISNNQTNNQSSPTNEHSNIASVPPPITAQSNDHPSTPTNVIQPAEQPVEQPVEQPIEQPTNRSIKLNPDDRKAVALYDWETNERGELSFVQDERLVVCSQKHGWFVGYSYDQAIKQTSSPGKTPAKKMFPSTHAKFVKEWPNEPATHKPLEQSIEQSIAPTQPVSPDQSTKQTPIQSTVSSPRNLPPVKGKTDQPIDLSIHQSINQLIQGSTVQKFDRSGRELHAVKLYLAIDSSSNHPTAQSGSPSNHSPVNLSGNKSNWLLKWDTKKIFNKSSAAIKLHDCRVQRGLKHPVKPSLQKSTNQSSCFTLMSPTRDLMIVCSDVDERDRWVDGLIDCGCVLLVSLDGMEAPPSTPAINPAINQATFSHSRQASFQSIHQANNQSVNHSVNHSISQSPASHVADAQVINHQPVAQSITIPVNTPAKDAVAIDPIINQPVTAPADQSSNQSVDQLINQPVEQSVAADVASDEPKPSAVTQLSSASLNLLPRARAEFPYPSSAEHPEDLGLMPGDIVCLIDCLDDKDWWEGVRMRDQMQGIFPKQYVTKF